MPSSERRSSEDVSAGRYEQLEIPIPIPEAAAAPDMERPAEKEEPGA
jgi:hypothetical protein